MSTHEIGKKLENFVSSYYEAMGYRVIRNTNVAGHQLDLLASRHMVGAGLVNLMIEVKSRSNSSVGINEVTPFVITAQALLIGGHIQAAILVTDSEFTQDANAAVPRNRGIRLATIRDLECDLFNYSESLMKVRHDYELSKAYREFIRLSGKKKEGNEIDDLTAYV